MATSRILLVEDDPRHQELLGMALRENGEHFDVTVVNGYREFLSTIQSNTYDCVVMDFKLIDGTAIDLLPKLRECHPGCPAIVCSSADDQSVVIESMREGTVDFVPKKRALCGDELSNRVQLALTKKDRRDRDRRRLERRHHRLIQLADTDPLTGLRNRRGLQRTIKFDRRGLFNRRELTALIMLDVDHFKRINDAHGHAAGDRVLKRLAATISQLTGDADVVCRWGGEEFLVIRGNTNLPKALSWAEELRNAVSNTQFDLGAGVGVTASFGIAVVAPDCGIERGVEQADAALYLAKRRGRNQVCTSEAVAIEHLIEMHRQSTLMDSLDVLLKHIRPNVGSTQWECVTQHSKRVASFAVQLGEAMAMHEGDIERLRRAGLCHDLGKLSVPEALLAKPGRLSEEEWMLVSRTPREAARFSELLGADVDTCNWLCPKHGNSAGYLETPLGARVVKVADAFVAMRSYRAYRPSLSIAAAVHELKVARFDPEVVRAAEHTLLLAPQTGVATI